MKVDKTAFAIKSSVLLLILAALPLRWSILTCLFVTWVYQYIIAIIYNCKAMPSMDTVCFMGEDTARVNFMSAQMCETVDFEYARKKCYGYVRDKAKLRSHVIRIFGDYYWKRSEDLEKVIDVCINRIPDGTLKNERDVEKFCAEQINSPIPLDRPQWLCWIQVNYSEGKSLIIYKQHHSMCDGISCMNFHIG